ncbi:MAG: UPF0280 family protein [Candidatus Omnitrophota bacterium]|nr:UPF0280 family protein [Candidatus Omnitrophota bacterium]
MKRKTVKSSEKYRSWVTSKDLVNFEVLEGESDLFISAKKKLTVQAERLTRKCRKTIQDHIARYPRFKDSLQPINKRSSSIPQIVREMLSASRVANVGPMAAIAGAVAEYVGKGILDFSSEVIVENGGDVFIRSSQDRIMGIYTGESVLSGKVALRLTGLEAGLGVCTSSGKIGHSLSFGKADSVTVISDSAPLADAAATAVGNIVKTPDNINQGIERAREIKGVKGVVIIVGKKLGIWGEVEII